MTTQSSQFDLRGFHHVALVCKDMQETVDFYEGILGFPLVKTLELGEHGQHFFFQVTEDDGVAFFWFSNVSPQAPGIASADWNAGETTPSQANGLVSKAAVGAMHHLSFGVPGEKLEEYRDRLQEAGIEVTEVMGHDDNGKECLRSIYFQDPDGIVLEFSAWTEPLAAGTSTFTPALASEATARRRDGVPVTI